MRFITGSPHRLAMPRGRGGIFINNCSTGQDSLLPHSKAPSSPRIAGLLQRSRNCSRRGNPKQFNYRKRLSSRESPPDNELKNNRASPCFCNVSESGKSCFKASRTSDNPSCHPLKAYKFSREFPPAQSSDSRGVACLGNTFYIFDAS